MSDRAGIHALHVAEAEVERHTEREQLLADALHETTLELIATRQRLAELQERHFMLVLERRGYIDCDRSAAG